MLVTGGAGYIGSHAVLALLDAGAEVSVLDDLSTGQRWAVDPAAHFTQGNAGDAALVDTLLAARKIDAILHFAGSVVVPESVADPLKYYRNNTVNACTLLACAVRAGVPHFIFSSTAAVYGVPAQPRVTEATPTNPINPYGASKRMTEIMLADVAAAHPLCYAALRYFNVAGADCQGRSGQSTPNATHLIKVACEAALGKRAGLAIFGTDYPTRDGTGVRDYIHVGDLVDAHVATLAHLIDHPGDNLVMNLGYGHGFSVREVLAMVEKVAGVALKVEEAPRRAGDPAELVADIAHLRRTLGWTPRHDDLHTIIATALEWERRLARRGDSI
ncbi:MAG: UDP-glucose 4-epimerase GalE [Alphaproteobacteria bacterium]|nr:MAG: UDP-glucose 4-epimerase GalE [Alphaproteobacteria bacterium]